MLILQMILECQTPLHCGSGAADPLLDQPVTRDAWGIWRIPGSSLAGSLRAMCHKLDKGMEARLFGEQKDDQSRASLVWCPDALLLDYDLKPAPIKKQQNEKVLIPLDTSFIRDHVKLDLERDSAVDGGKFDDEIVPPGARFLAEFRLDAWDDQKSPLTDGQKACFDKLCAHVLAGHLELGGQATNGYGRYKVICHSYQEIDLLKPEDMEIWLNTGYGSLPVTDGIHARRLEPAPVPAGDDLSGDMSLPLICDGPILIGGGSPVPGDQREADADMIFALSPWLNYEEKKLDWRWVIPGSSLKGVFRHTVYDILRDLNLSDKDAKVHLRQLFGHEEDGGQCGKLRFEDCRLADKPAGPVIQHVSIDRFTGGAVNGALFDEEPLWKKGLEFRLPLHVAGADAKEAALIFHALLDLADGLLSVGSGANRGNGRLQAPSGKKPLELMEGNLLWKGKPILGPENSTALGAALEEWDLELMKEMGL